MMILAIPGSLSGHELDYAVVHEGPNAACEASSASSWYSAAGGGEAIVTAAHECDAASTPAAAHGGERAAAVIGVCGYADAGASVVPTALSRCAWLPERRRSRT